MDPIVTLLLGVIFGATLQLLVTLLGWHCVEGQETQARRVRPIVIVVPDSLRAQPEADQPPSIEWM